MMDLLKSKMMISFLVFMIGITLFDCLHTNKKNCENDENLNYIVINSK